MNTWDTEASLLLELPRIQASLEATYRLVPELLQPDVSETPLVFNDLGQYASIEHIVNFFTEEWELTDNSPAGYFEDDVNQIDFDRSIYQLVYLFDSEPLIIAMLGLYTPILRSKLLMQQYGQFQKRMLWAFSDEVNGLLGAEEIIASQPDRAGLFDWRDNRNRLPLEKIQAYLQFAGLPLLEDPDVPPAWVFRDLCAYSATHDLSDEALRAELCALYQKQDHLSQFAFQSENSSYQQNLFGWRTPENTTANTTSEQYDLLDKANQPTISEKDIHDLDQLFLRSTEYRQSTNYVEMLEFISKQKEYAPYNAYLMLTQHPDMTHAETADEWKRKFDRDIRPNARPMVILIPFGPVNFVYDIDDTVGPPLPADLVDPFRARGELPPRSYDNLHTNCARMDVVIQNEVLKNKLAGNVCRHEGGYLIKLNQNHTKEVRFATLVHELAHLLCGHLGCRLKKDKWQDRSNLDQKQEELEAESVSYLVCKRLGIISEAEAYLSGYVKEHDTVENISLHHVLTVAGKILTMCDRLVVKKGS